MVDRASDRYGRIHSQRVDEISLCLLGFLLLILCATTTVAATLAKFRLTRPSDCCNTFLYYIFLPPPVCAEHGGLEGESKTSRARRGLHFPGTAVVEFWRLQAAARRVVLRQNHTCNNTGPGRGSGCICA